MKLLSVKETVEELGISRATLYRLVDEGLPYTTVGARTKKFDPDEVRDFLKNRNTVLQSNLEIGREYTNDEIVRMFSISTQGGMRRSNSKNALVLFSTHTGLDRLYEDYWKDGILYYTGMGQIGDQDIDFAQNRTLKESNNTSIVVYLFEMYRDQYYRYRGIVKLEGEPFQENETDLNGDFRKVWKFPLKVISPLDYLPESYLAEAEKNQEKSLKRLDDRALMEKAKAASEASVDSNMTVRHKVYVRDQAISRYVKRRAHGFCQLCEQPAPFKVDGEPYLEEHHVIPLSEGGSDKIENACALCPNCHTRMHRLNLQTDKEKIYKKMAEDEAWMMQMTERESGQ